jgi:hypothetical protein
MKVNGRIIEGIAIDYASVSYRRARFMDGAVADAVIMRRLRSIGRDNDREVKPAYLYGYTGYRLADVGVFVGIKDDRILEIVSGRVASTYDLCRDRDDVRVNRLDVQATLLLGEYQTLTDAARLVEYEIDRIYQHIVQYRSSAKGAMARLTYSRVQSVSVDSIVGTTLYIGARSSDMMIRVYNKTSEARLGDSLHSSYPALLRIEIESKGAYAEQIRNDWLRMPEYRSILYAEILRRYDIEVGVKAVSGYKLASQAMLSKDTDRTMRWLRRSVNPAIQRLLVQGIDREQLIALLFDQSDQSDMTNNE